jgi:hypothetical protein
VLDLTAAEEITVMDNLDILDLNGFSVQVDESAKVGERVKLLAQPVSGNTSWDVSGTNLHKSVVGDQLADKALASRSRGTSTLDHRARIQ